MASLLSPPQGEESARSSEFLILLQIGDDVVEVPFGAADMR